MFVGVDIILSVFVGVDIILSVFVGVDIILSVFVGVDIILSVFVGVGINCVFLWLLSAATKRSENAMTNLDSILEEVSATTLTLHEPQ